MKFNDYLQQPCFSIEFPLKNALNLDTLDVDTYTFEKEKEIDLYSRNPDILEPAFKNLQNLCLSRHAVTQKGVSVFVFYFCVFLN